jgi:hypothetical protein
LSGGGSERRGGSTELESGEDFREQSLSDPLALREDVMSENEKPKQPLATDVIANAPRRDTYSPEEHGSGNPHLQPGELQNSKTGSLTSRQSRLSRRRNERSSTATLGRHSYAEGYQGHFHQHGQQNCSDKRPQHSIPMNHHLSLTFKNHSGCLSLAPLSGSTGTQEVRGGVPEFLRRGFDGGMLEELCAGQRFSRSKETSALALKKDPIYAELHEPVRDTLDDRCEILA